MIDNDVHDKQLSRLLRQVPDRTLPAGLVEQILETVGESKKQYSCSEKHSFFSFLWWDMLWPRQFVAVSCALALAFFLGLYAGGKKEDTLAQPGTLQLPGYVYQNAQAGFLVGRGLLAAGKRAEALAMIQHASKLSPKNPEYLFWLGTAHWRMGNTELEQQSYRSAVQVDPEYLPALVNLGHNLLESKQLEEAVETYNRVLAIAPDHQMVLYNRALAVHMTRNSDQATNAWKQYLSFYRTGKWSQRAVQHLNEQGDFSYRAYQIGVRRIVLDHEVLLGPLTARKKQEVEYLAEMFRQAPVATLNLAFFYENDVEKARTQAVALKSLLTSSLQNNNKVIRTSWFAEPESVQTASGMKNLQNGLLLFSQLQPLKTKRRSI